MLGVGAKPGEVFKPSGWEWTFAGMSLLSQGQEEAARREFDAVANLLAIEALFARATAREPELVAEMARVLDEEVLDDARTVAAYKRLLELRPGDPKAEEAIETSEAKRGRWADIVAKYVDEAKTAAWIADGLIFEQFGPAKPQHAVTPPDRRFPNYMYYRGGHLHFSKKILMTDSDMQVIDAEPNTPFDFNLAKYMVQLMAGYSRTLSNGGLWVWPFDATGPAPVELQPGDALVMHPELPHASGLNRQGAMRYAVYFRFLE